MASTATRSRNSTPLGVFNGFHSDTFPATLRDSWMYAAFTGGRGEVKVTFRLTDAGELDARPVFEARDVPVTFAGPLDVSEALLQFTAVPFPKPGIYAWQVVCEGAVVYERRILVRKIG